MAADASRLFGGPPPQGDDLFGAPPPPPPPPPPQNQSFPGSSASRGVNPPPAIHSGDSMSWNNAPPPTTRPQSPANHNGAIHNNEARSSMLLQHKRSNVFSQSFQQLATPDDMSGLDLFGGGPPVDRTIMSNSVGPAATATATGMGLSPIHSAFGFEPDSGSHHYTHHHHHTSMMASGSSTPLSAGAPNTHHGTSSPIMPTPSMSIPNTRLPSMTRIPPTTTSASDLFGGTAPMPQQPPHPMPPPSSSMPMTRTRTATPPPPSSTEPPPSLAAADLFGAPAPAPVPMPTQSQSQLQSYPPQQQPPTLARASSFSSTASAADVFGSTSTFTTAAVSHAPPRAASSTVATHTVPHSMMVPLVAQTMAIPVAATRTIASAADLFGGSSTVVPRSTSSMPPTSRVAPSLPPASASVSAASVFGSTSMAVSNHAPPTMTAPAPTMTMAPAAISAPAMAPAAPPMAMSPPLASDLFAASEPVAFATATTTNDLFGSGPPTTAAPIPMVPHTAPAPTTLEVPPPVTSRTNHDSSIEQAPRMPPLLTTTMTTGRERMPPPRGVNVVPSLSLPRAPPSPLSSSYSLGRRPKAVLSFHEPPPLTMEPYSTKKKQVTTPSTAATTGPTATTTAPMDTIVSRVVPVHSNGASSSASKRRPPSRPRARSRPRPARTTAIPLLDYLPKPPRAGTSTTVRRAKSPAPSLVVPSAAASAVGGHAKSVADGGSTVGSSVGGGATTANTSGSSSFRLPPPVQIRSSSTLFGTPSRSMSSSIVSPMSSPYVTKPTLTMPSNMSSNPTMAPPTLQTSVSSSAAATTTTTVVHEAVKRTDKMVPTTREERSLEKDQQQQQHQRKLSFSSVDKATNAASEISLHNSMGSLNLKEPPNLNKTFPGGKKPPLSLSTHHDVYPPTRKNNDKEIGTAESCLSQDLTPVMANHHGVQTTSIMTNGGETTNGTTKKAVPMPVPAPPPPPLASSLPPGWAELVDPTSQRVYYYNETTRASTWERPILTTHPVPPPHLTANEESNTIGASMTDRTETEEIPIAMKTATGTNGMTMTSTSTATMSVSEMVRKDEITDVASSMDRMSTRSEYGGSEEQESTTMETLVFSPSDTYEERIQKMGVSERMGSECGDVSMVTTTGGSDYMTESILSEAGTFSETAEQEDVPDQSSPEDEVPALAAAVATTGSSAGSATDEMTGSMAPLATADGGSGEWVVVQDSAQASSSSLFDQQQQQPFSPEEETQNDDLAAGWTEMMDAASGMPYYFNEETGVTTWDRPLIITSLDSAEVDSRIQLEQPPQEPILSVAVSTTTPVSSSIVDPPLTLDHDDIVQPEEELHQDQQRAPEESAVPEETAAAAVLAPASGGWDHVEEIPDEGTGTGDPLSQEALESPAMEAPAKDSNGTQSVDNIDNDPRTAGLPEGWIEHLDRTHGLPFYENLLSGETSWEKPLSTVEDTVNICADEGDSAAMNQVEVEGNEQSSSGPEEHVEEHDVTPHEIGGQNEPTQLEPSPETEAITNPPPQSLLPPGWTEAIDPSSGNPYYVNEANGTTTWDRPALTTEDEASSSVPTVTTEEKVDTATPDDNVGEEHPTEPEPSPEIEEEEDTAAPPQTELPPGWIEAIDPTSGIPYYVNDAEGFTTWDKPELQTGDVAVLEAEVEETVTSPVTEEVDESVPLDDGEPTKPESPPEIEEEEATVPPPQSDLPPGWTEAIDPTSGNPYYVNEGEGITTWDKPQTETEDSNIVPTGQVEDETEDAISPEVAEEDIGTTQFDANHDQDDPTELAPSSKAEGDDDAAAPLPEADLPPGWTKAIDPTSGIPYYVNEAKGITTWDKPEIHAAADIAPLPEDQKEVELIEVISPEVAKEDVGARVPENNHEKEDDPRELAPPSEPEEDVTLLPPQSDLPPGWTEAIDPTSGDSYYVNDAEGITTWEKPEISAEDTSPLSVKDAEVEEEMLISPEVTNDHVEKMLPDGNNEQTDPTELEPSPEAEKEVEPPPPQSDLPPGWTSVIDPTSGMSYYVNEAEGTTTWDKPELQIKEPDSVPVDLLEPAAEEKSDNPEVDAVLPDERNNDKDPIPSPEAERTEDASFPLSMKDAELEVETPISPEVTNDHVEETLPDGNNERTDPTELEPSPEVEKDVDLSPSQSDLPPGWTSVIDPTSGMPYYVNEAEGTTTWDKPELQTEEPDSVPVDHLEPTAEEKSDNPEVDAVLPDERNNDKDPIPSPEAEKTEDATFPPAQSDLPSGWTEVIDPTSGNPYYVNDAEGITSWDKPVLQTEPNAPVEPTLGEETIDHQPLTSTGPSIQSSPEVATPELEPEKSNDIDKDYVHVDKEPSAVTQPDQTEEEKVSENQATTLPPGWEELIDPSSGNPYYFNEEENRTSWDRPEAPTDAPRLIAEPIQTVGSDHAKEKRSASVGELSSIIPIAPTEPEENASKPVQEVSKKESEPSSLPPGWVEVIDETSGVPYYFNEVENTTTWDMPSLPDTDSTVTTAPAAVDSATPSLRPAGAATLTNASKLSSASTSEFRRCGPHAIASFGFGGRLCVMFPQKTGLSSGVSSMPITKGHVVVHRLSSFVKMPGGTVSHVQPLNSAKNNDVATFLDKKDELKKDILWSLIHIAARSRGRLRSDEGIQDPNGPEAAIVNLLLDYKARSSRSQFPSPSPNRVKTSAKQENPGSLATLDKVQDLLVRGKRENAVLEALSGKEYALGLLVATMCDRNTFRNAACRFADEAMSMGSPLHTLAMMFSGHLELPGDDTLDRNADSSHSFWSNIGHELKDTWRYHLATVLSNRTPGWDRIVLSLGDRLLQLGEVPAAHFCYMVCGCPVTSPSLPSSRLVLVGCDHIIPAHTSLMTDAGVQSFERTEAFEWAKRRGNPNAAIPALQPFKLSYANLLADYSQEEHALKYVKSIRKSICLDSGSSSGRKNAPSSMTSLPELPPLAFIESLDALEGRLLGSLGKTPNSSKVAKKISNKMSVSRFSKQTHSALPVPDGQQSKKQFHQVPSSAVTFKPEVKPKSLPIGKAVVEGDVGKINVDVGTTNNLVKASVALDDETHKARCSAPSLPKTMQSPLPKTMLSPPVDMDQTVYKSFETQGIDQSRANLDASFVSALDMSLTSLVDTKAAAHKKLEDPTKELGLASKSPFDSKVSTGIEKTLVSPFGHAPPAATGSSEPPAVKVDTSRPTGIVTKHTDTPGTQSAPPTVSRAAVRTPDTKRDQKAPSSNNTGSGNWLTSSVTKLLGISNNATVADLGESNQAHYDEKLKRWVFPGDNVEELAKPLAPPPIMPNTPNNDTPEPVPATPNDDPLAALMAPPTRAPSSLRRTVPGALKTPGGATPKMMMMPPTGAPFGAKPALMKTPAATSKDSNSTKKAAGPQFSSPQAGKMPPTMFQPPPAAKK